MLTNIKQRFEWIIAHHYDGVYSRLAKALEVDASTITAILAEKSKPSWKVTERILEVHPEISAEWLMRGLGDPMSEVNNDITELRVKYNKLREAIKKFERLFADTKFDL